MNIQHWNPEIDGPLSETAMISKLEKLGYRCIRYVYPPGTRFPDHSHGIDKIDAVLKGKFRISMPDCNIILQPGDYISVPSNITHNAEVIGDESVVSIDAIKIT